MDNIVKRLLAVNPPDITFVSVITWLVHCVEIYSTSVNTGKGSSKLALLHANVPVFLHQAVQLNLVTEQRAAQLQAQIDGEWQLVAEIVGALVNVAHNPEFVQIENEVQACCAPWRKRL